MPSSNWKEISTATFEAATALFVQQHVRILVDSIQLFLTSKNKEIRKSRYQLACQHYGELNRVHPYTTKEQRKIVDKTIDAFVKADDLYRHPNRAQVKKAKNDDFWETYAIFEMMEIFSGDDE
ncbi:MAG: hypothetical protein SOX18_07765 [Lachnospiraceae bacterium]|nr:hypothetical protein [Lachnospiraceae bacterium]